MRFAANQLKIFAASKDSRKYQESLEMGAKCWQMAHNRYLGSTVRMPFISPLSESRKSLIVNALYNHLVQPSSAWPEDCDDAMSVCNWIGAESESNLLQRSIAEGESLLSKVSTFTSMSNDPSHPRVAACVNATEPELALRGAVLACALVANYGRCAGTHLIGLLECNSNSLHNQYKLKLGAVHIYQTDETDDSSWDFQFGWEKSHGHMQVSVEGELIDNGFVQRLSCVMEWEQQQPQPPAIASKKRARGSSDYLGAEESFPRALLPNSKRMKRLAAL